MNQTRIITDSQRQRRDCERMLQKAQVIRPFVAIIAIAVTIVFISDRAGFTQTKPKTLSQTTKENTKVNKAKGTFEVKTIPQTTDNKEAETAKIARMSLDKQFLGDLQATSTGEMIFTGTDVEGSGVYVALERISGTLNGKSGTFVLHHVGIMTRNEPHLTVSVAPDSGTGELVGIAGKMDIIIKDGKHFYEFEYTLLKDH